MPFAQAAQPVCSRDSTRSHSVTCLPAQLSFHSPPPYHLPPYFTGQVISLPWGRYSRSTIHRLRTNPEGKICCKAGDSH